MNRKAEGASAIESVLWLEDPEAKSDLTVYQVHEFICEEKSHCSFPEVF